MRNAINSHRLHRHAEVSCPLPMTSGASQTGGALSDRQPLQNVQHPAGHLVGARAMRLLEGPLTELTCPLRFAEHV